MSRSIRRISDDPEPGVLIPPSTTPQTNSSTAGLGKRTTTGFAWLLAQSVLSKVAGLVAQLLWTHFLSPNDFGLFTIAYAVTLGVGWMQVAGTREILVRRPKHYERRVNSAFWLAVVIAFSGYLLMWFLAPVLERFYAQPGLALLIRITALSPTSTTLANIPQAKLEIDMRFALLARANLVSLVFQSALTVVLAAYGAGAKSFAIPIALAAILHDLYLYFVTRPPLKLKIEFAKWKYLLNGIGLLIVAGACNFVLWQGDNIILGRLVLPAELGLYAFAYNLSQQTLFLLSNNINSVLLPTLSRLNLERERQLDVYMRAIRALAVVGVLLCLLPGVVSPALLGLFFKAKWAGAAPILMVLSVGMAIRVVDTTGDALLKAQGRFSTVTALGIAQAATFAMAGVIATHFRGVLGMACAVTACIALFGPLRVYMAVKPLGGSVQNVFNVFGGAFVLFALSQVGPLFLAHWLFPGSHIATLSLSVVLGTMIYFSLLRVLAPALWNDMLARFKRKSAT